LSIGGIRKTFLTISLFLQGDRNKVFNTEIPFNGSGRVPLFRSFPFTCAIKPRYSLAPAMDHEMINDETRDAACLSKMTHGRYSCVRPGVACFSRKEGKA